MVASTVAPEWDDAERAKMAALAEWEAGIGPCGHHHAETVDPEHFFFEWANFKCPVCAEVDRHERMKAAEEEQWLKQFGEKGPEPTVPRPTDGRAEWTRRIPEDEARERKKRQEQREVDGGHKA
jgi:hypothetical protein